MKKVFILLGIIAGLQACRSATDKGTVSEAADAPAIDTAVYNQLYERYHEPALSHRRFKPHHIVSLLEKHRQGGLLRVEEIGHSVEGRGIYKVQYGKGQKKVMLWSQMHGDEPTATQALFDIFNFLEGRDDGFDSLRSLLQERLSLHFIPMLNPDGAERYMRRNAQYIDLNRDARATQTVEGKLLKKMAKEIQPDFGFNLHDQHGYYNVPGTKNPVAIALLAPAFNPAGEINKVRKAAMQLAVGINRVLQQYVPNAVAKYDDTHSPRGFGDNFQAWGASTVLIESGALKGDPEKQELRRFNFAIILNALLEIARDSYQQYDVEDYDSIPFSASELHDVLLRHIEVGTDSVPLQTDIAIRRAELTVDTDYCVRGWIEDIGDLADLSGYEELDGTGLKFVEGKVYPQTFGSIAEIDNNRAWEILKGGYLAVRVAAAGQSRLHQLPLLVSAFENVEPTDKIVLTGSSNFFLGDGKVLKYAVVNGYLIDLSRPPQEGFYKNWIN